MKLVNLTVFIIFALMLGASINASSQSRAEWNDPVAVQRAFEQRPADAFQAVTATISQQQAIALEVALLPTASDDDAAAILEDVARKLKAAKRSDLADLITRVESKADEVKPGHGDDDGVKTKKNK